MPHIVVELIHIEGPLKGEIQEFSGPQITIGRHPTCHSRFPKDLTIVSRQHAKIIREGNRFRIVDESTNGTFVNGKRITDTYLKDGDVIMLAEGGPKTSFLTRIEEGEHPLQETGEPPSEPSAAIPEFQPPQPPRTPRREKPSEPVIQKRQISLVIQYGPTLQSFRELPVTLGSGNICDFKLDHPGLADQHAQIFFSDNQYWIKDLTAGSTISLNGDTVDRQAPLDAEDIITLSESGPAFRFLGGGRLAEIDSPRPEPDPLHPVTPEKREDSSEKKKENTRPLKKPGSLLKKLFK